MTRPPRIEFPGAVYYVTTRGNADHSVVDDDADRTKWASVLADAAQRYAWRVYAFALLDDRYHIFFQTREATLATGMRDLNGNYAVYHSARHHQPGHLFRGRYQAVLVEPNGHMADVSRHVHLSPVRAGLVPQPEQWRWSSYVGYCSTRRRRDWIDYGTVLAEFGADESGARRAYRDFVVAGLNNGGDLPLSRGLRGVVLGSPEFAGQVLRQFRRRGTSDVAAALVEQHRRRPSIGKVIRIVADVLDADPSRWVPGKRSNDMARAAAAYASRELTGASCTDIARALGYRNVSSIVRACCRVEKAMIEPDFAHKVRSLLDLITRNGRPAEPDPEPVVTPRLAEPALSH